MPRIILTLTLLILLFTSSVSGQKLEPPKLESTPLTTQQKQLVQEGAALHDKGDYDGAISRYEEVLKENPVNTKRRKYECILVNFSAP